MKQRKWVIAVLLAPFLALTALLLLSVWNVAVQSFGYIPAFGLTELTTEHYEAVLQDETFLQALGVSLRIAVVSAVLAAVLGVLIAAALIRCRKTDGAMLYLVRMPILIPHAVVAVFSINLLSQAGLAARVAAALGLIAEQSQFPQLLFTPDYGGAIAAYLWKEIPFVAYFVLAFMSSISETLGEAAENLGASPVRSFFEVTLPSLLPGMLSSMSMGFVLSYSQYFTTLMVGGGRIKTIALVLIPYIQSGDRALSSIYCVAFVGSALLVFHIFESLIQISGKGEGKK